MTLLLASALLVSAGCSSNKAPNKSQDEGPSHESDAGSQLHMDASPPVHEPHDAAPPRVDAEVSADAQVADSGHTVQADAGPPVSRTPTRLLLVDEGNAAVHYLDLNKPEDDWSYSLDVDDTCCNLMRDIQLIGNHRVLLSRPAGYVELDLDARGQNVKQVDLKPVPGGIESVRRLPNGHTIAAGNGGGGIFVYEFDENDTLMPEHKASFSGLDAVRAVRLTEQGTFVFASTTTSERAVYEGDWDGHADKRFTLPDTNPAPKNMAKAVRTGPDEITLSTGYAATLIRIDTAHGQVTKTIGGVDEPMPEGTTRALVPHFFAGYQIMNNGDLLVTNWVNHGRGHNAENYQLLQYDASGKLIWFLDQTEYPQISSLHNVIALDGLDLERLYDDRTGPLLPL